MGNNKPPYNGVSLGVGCPAPFNRISGKGDYRGLVVILIGAS